MAIQQGLGGENLSAILALQGRPEGRLLTVVVVLDLFQTRVVDVESEKNRIYIMNEIQARIAQMVAYWLGTRDVPGSNPGKGENFSMRISN